MRLAPVLAELERRGIEIRLERPRTADGRDAWSREALADPALGGGNRTFRLQSSVGPLFVKVQPSERHALLDAEADGLEALRAANALAVPAVRACGRTESEAYLALEWIDFAPASGATERRLGEGLARQHRCRGQHFGWTRDNAIGLTPQPNPPGQDWLAFWRGARLGFQLERAASNGLPQDCRAMGERLLERLESFFEGHAPEPSLLHGDLWGGNWGADRHGVPYVFDPAVYFGDRETDLAMTRLFGGFGTEFYRAYDSAWPLPERAEARVDLYNLYHLLNHFNIFGSGYLDAVRGALRRLTRRC